MWSVFEGKAISLSPSGSTSKPKRGLSPGSDCVRVACIEDGTHNTGKGKGHPKRGHEGPEVE